jgi:hypothetical protein
MKNLKTYQEFINEKLVLKDYVLYTRLVAEAYREVPIFDESAVRHWELLRTSNYTLFKRLLSKTKIIFISQFKENEGMVLDILDKSYKVFYYPDEPYESQEKMKQDWENTKSIMISIDYSDHPIFSVVDNIVFRCVHDFIIHILGNHPFGAKGEIASFNNHAKLVSDDVLPALFTEIVGQACFVVEYGYFAEQKIAVLKGFDYKQVGMVEDYEIEGKLLVPKGNLR